MHQVASARTADWERDTGRYRRHRPEQTLLYRIVGQRYPAFTTHLVAQGRELPGYVKCEFEDLDFLPNGGQDDQPLRFSHYSTCQTCNCFNKHASNKLIARRLIILMNACLS